MAGGKSAKSSNVSTVRKRVEAQAASLKRARDGSAFVRCEECNKDVAAALIGMHNCSSEAKLKTNLESLVVESQTEAIKKKPKTESVASKKERKPRDSKKPKDSNKPKRHTTAFFVFMEDFRKTFKEEHPDNKSVAVVAKEGGEKWKSLTDEEKKVYVDRAAERKAEYERNLKEQNDEAEDNEGDNPDEEAEKEDTKADKEGENEEVKAETVDDDE
ncbi:high mobility group B protein 7-like [Heracleum sosnowskyi]|uniref:High mobility group B protein 7-like n=1 Tax=Heracleum sosnowskyi TaxID=360622 RepID=A0AAD8ILS9_9APIA|nr:high mobility group B protein 7-like [Heracleum sosnowskyi]